MTSRVRPIRVSAAVTLKYRKRLQRANQLYKQRVDEKVSLILRDINALDRSKPGAFQQQVAKMQRQIKSLDRNLAAADKRSLRAVESFVQDMKHENEKRSLQAFRKRGSKEELKGKMAQRAATLDKRVEKLAAGYRESITSANRDYSDRVQQALYEKLGNPRINARKKIRRARGIVTRRIKNTVTDQAYELNATLNRSRSAAIGAKGYRWRSKRDHKVRPAHVEMDDGTTVHRWNKRPLVGGEGRVHPGEAHGCRCDAEPVFT